jgi:hypothetical protein
MTPVVTVQPEGEQERGVGAPAPILGYSDPTMTRVLLLRGRGEAR